MTLRRGQRGGTIRGGGRMAARPQKHLTDDERRALQLLAFNPHGATVEALVLGHGFKLQMLDDLVPARLAKRYRVTITADGQTTGVTVTYMKIMAAGRKAIEEREMMAVSPHRPRLTPKRRRALKLLASSRHGVNEELLVRGHGFSRGVLASLVLRGLAAAEHEVMIAWRQGDGGRSGQDYGGGAEGNRGMKATA
jgi:hypothetical protein